MFTLLEQQRFSCKGENRCNRCLKITTFFQSNFSTLSINLVSCNIILKSNFIRKNSSYEWETNTSQSKSWAFLHRNASSIGNNFLVIFFHSNCCFRQQKWGSFPCGKVRLLLNNPQCLKQLVGPFKAREGWGKIYAEEGWTWTAVLMSETYTERQVTFFFLEVVALPNQRKTELVLQSLPTGWRKLIHDSST